MQSEVDFKPLIEACEFIKDGDWIETKDQGDSGYRLLQINNIGVGEFVEKGKFRWVTEDTFRRLRCQKIEVGDVLVARMPEPTGRAWCVDELKWDCITAVDVAIIRTDCTKLDPRYCAYFLNSPKTLALVKSLETGTTRKRIRRSELEQIQIPLPDLPTQNAIADVLSNLDQKIKANHQMNATLESIAQALFKSWFVDFDPVIDNALEAGNPIPEPLQARADRRATLGDQRRPLPKAVQQQFPSSFVFTEEMGWVPKGWNTQPLAEVVEEIIDHRGKTPTKLGGEWSESGYPAISAKNIKNGRIIKPDAIRFVNEGLYNRWMKVPLTKGDVALTSEAPMGEIYYFASRTDYLLSQRVYGIRANKNLLSGSYLYFWLQTPYAKSDLAGRATGTTVVGIRQSELRKLAVLCPSTDLVQEFTKLVDGHLLRIDSNEIEKDALAVLRDTLMPKLLSGQLRIRDAENQLAEAI